jgi:general secretion pathway protein G
MFQTRLSCPPDQPRASLAQRGFTLIEMVVTLALLGVMAMLAAPLAEMTVQRSKEQELRASLREIRSAIDRYKRAADQGLLQRAVGDSGYPPTLEVLVAGVPNQGDVKGARLYFLRRLPRDPLSGDATLAAAATWGLRSHASPADDPREGEDVFDVFTRSPNVGLNGVPYRDW